MNTILIGYDLNRPGQNYPGLITAIKRLGSWWHHLDSTWIVETKLSPSEVRDQLKRHVDTGDEIFVVDITDRTWASWGLNQRANRWLNSHVAA